MQINHAIEVATILRHNIVQGAREDGNEAAKWGMYLCIVMRDFALWALLVWVQEANPVLELRIHDEIERGDNDTIKVGDQDVKIHKACSS